MKKESNKTPSNKNAEPNCQLHNFPISGYCTNKDNKLYPFCEKCLSTYEDTIECLEKENGEWYAIGKTHKSQSKKQTLIFTHFNRD